MNASPSQSAGPPDYRYWAFISYSTHDRRAARRLHRAIETYGIPAQLVHHHLPTGDAAPKRFHPLFIDRAELPASGDLRTEIADALRDSRYLIVVCSPHAAQSTWVNREIETFRALGRQDRVLAIIIAGEPNSKDDLRECFPPALRIHEPIAADARPTGDGEANAKLKLLAGMLGVSYDALKQRDTHRRMRRLRILVAASLALALAMGSLAWYANHQRIKAVKAREQAESILGYLLFDLRHKLAPIGRLDIARDIQDQVDHYYAELGVEAGQAQILSNRAMAYFTDGDRLLAEHQPQAALDAYGQGMQSVQRSIAAEPANLNWQDLLASGHARLAAALEAQGDLAGALVSYREGLLLLQQLAKTQPSNLAWPREVANHELSVGRLLRDRGELPEALQACREALAIRQRLADADPGLVTLQTDLVDALVAVAEVLELQHDPAAVQYGRRVLDTLSELERKAVPLSAYHKKLLRSVRNHFAADPRGTPDRVAR